MANGKPVESERCKRMWLLWVTVLDQKLLHIYPLPPSHTHTHTHTLMMQLLGWASGVYLHTLSLSLSSNIRSCFTFFFPHTTHSCQTDHTTMAKSKLLLIEHSVNLVLINHLVATCSNSHQASEYKNSFPVQ